MAATPHMIIHAWNQLLKSAIPAGMTDQNMDTSCLFECGGCLRQQDAAFLLRYPTVTSPDKAGSCLADRCLSLPALPPPPAAVESLPRFELATSSLLKLFVSGMRS